jgi:hypothetical protein
MFCVQKMSYISMRECWRGWLKFRTHNPGKVVSYVRFEVLMAVIMKDTVFWDVMLCSVLEDYLCFGEMYCPNLQGWRVSKTGCKLVHGSNAFLWCVEKFCLTTWCRIPEGCTFHNHCCENLRHSISKLLPDYFWSHLQDITIYQNICCCSVKVAGTL